MADNNLNVIPSYYAAGSYTANNPFDSVVIAGKYYKVEGIRSAAEMQGENLNLFQLVFNPAGVAESDYQAILDDLTNKSGAILVLIGLDGSRVYVPTTYLASFPLVDGVSFERMCIFADLGSVPPSMADTIKVAMQHFQDYLLANVGVAVTMNIGTMPTIGYVSKDQADVFETTRKNKITNTQTDAALIVQQENTIAQQATYIQQLENALKATNP